MPQPFYIPKKWPANTHGIEGCVGLIAGMDAEVKRKISICWVLIELL
jgi:hypothetical protein